MPFLIAVLVIVGFVWLLQKVSRLSDQVDTLSRMLNYVQLEARRLKERLDELQTGAPPAAAESPTPESGEQLSSKQAEAEAATLLASAPNVPVQQAVAPPLPSPETIPVAPPILQEVKRAVIERVDIPPVGETPPVISFTAPFAASTTGPKPETTEPASPTPQRAPAKGSFEMRLGTYWLVRVGIVMLLTGLVFFGNYAYHNFIGRIGAAGKVSLLYLASALLLGGGAWWQRKASKESLRNYGQVLFAGGLAFVYFTTYAAHHIDRLRIIESAALDGMLLLAWAGFMVWIADRRKSEVLALFAVGLAYYTSVITQVGDFTLYSNLVLTLAAVFFLVRNRWAWLSFASLVATYAAYAFWRFFHGGEWRWATPEEGLWHGAYFLMSYWAVFTAAVFLSKHEKLAGQNRAAFLTFNNGAFFTLFLPTMLQVHSGKFWQFSLIYGAVLLALVEVSRRIFPNEPLTKHSYLTQGLLLITLGFITKYSGLQLALVLAAESVVLFVLGTARRSLILQIGAYLAGAISIVCGFDGVERFDTHGLWLGAALGGMMVVNSFWAHRQEPATEAAPVRSVPVYFTALALLVWCFTTWQNTTHANFGLVLTLEALVIALSIYLLRFPELALMGQAYIVVAQVAWQFDVPKSTAQLTALVLAVECLALLRVGWQRNNQAWRICGYVAAALAVAWGIEGLERNQTSGLLTGVALTASMLLSAFLTHRKTDQANKSTLRPEPTYFSALVVVLAGATTWFNTAQDNCPLLFAAEAIVLTALVYFLRVREVALVGQTLLLAAHCLWQFNLLERGTPPWWNPVLLVAMTLGLGHWWQKQRIVTVEKRLPLVFQLMLSVLFVLLVCRWLGRECSDATWLALSCLLAAAVTAYAVVTRAWLLAACAQLFLLPGAWLFAQQLLHDGEPRFAALAPVAALAVLSFATVQWFKRKPDELVQDPLLKLAMAYRWVALAMSLWWVMEYIPNREQIWTLMSIGLAVFVFAGWRRNREALMFGAVFTGLALVLLWTRAYQRGYVYLPDALAILALLGQQQIAQRLPARYALDQRAHAIVIASGGLSSWLFVSRWVLQSASGFYLTASWSGLALILFAGGMALRERMYRWLGLVVLAGALGRVVVFDVWKLETLYRILSFMALGIVLLVLGFIYNKYQEKIKEWL
ncbi:MAG: DUF2339 domain-containing protein [Verrucomicrobia bacterium]|nr:DUF2339 domain-containing protein [Verrucomicrobiota bacterium]